MQCPWVSFIGCFIKACFLRIFTPHRPFWKFFLAPTQQFLLLYFSRLTKNGAYDTVHRVNQGHKEDDPSSTSTTVKVRESSHEYD